MKIAAVSDDGTTISQHFGRAQYYVVVTVEDGQLTDHETRDKLGHMPFADDPHDEENDPPGQGLRSAANYRHAA